MNLGLLQVRQVFLTSETSLQSHNPILKAFHCLVVCNGEDETQREKGMKEEGKSGEEANFPCLRDFLKERLKWAAGGGAAVIRRASSTPNSELHSNS